MQYILRDLIRLPLAERLQIIERAIVGLEPVSDQQAVTFIHEIAERLELLQARYPTHHSPDSSVNHHI